MKPKGSLPHSQAYATCLCLEPDQYSPCPHPTTWRSSLVLSSHLRLGLPSCISCPWVSPPKSSNHFFVIRATCLTNRILLDLIIHIIVDVQYRSYSLSLCSLITPLLPPPLKAQIFSWTQYSLTSEAYARPSVWKTKFYTHTNEMQNYSSVYFNLYICG